MACCVLAYVGVVSATHLAWGNFTAWYEVVMSQVGTNGPLSGAKMTTWERNCESREALQLTRLYLRTCLCFKLSSFGLRERLVVY